MLAASDSAVTPADADAPAPTGALPQQLSDNMVPCFLVCDHRLGRSYVHLFASRRLGYDRGVERAFHEQDPA